MNEKKALVLTYHVKDCTRVGGFHSFIDFLCQDGYDVDWITIPMSSSWIIRHNDKENAKNFINLLRGIEFENRGSYVRHFSVPVWLPARIAKFFNKKLGNHYWPAWKKIKKRLLNKYDVILVEGSACQYADDIKRDYPNAQIIYRPSDVLSMFSNVPNPEELEKRMILVADITLCVDETSLIYYKKLAGDKSRVEILRNPITTENDIKELQLYKPQIREKLLVTYIGVSYVDFELVEYAARKNTSAMFVMVGPFGMKSHDNIIYTGTLSKLEYEEYLKKSCVGINPLNSKMIQSEKGITVGYTRKIINYMKYLMPIVATCSSNYLNVDGFFCVENKEKFSNKIAECLRYSSVDREKLRDGYLYAMRIFSKEESRRKFLSIVHNGK